MKAATAAGVLLLSACLGGAHADDPPSPAALLQELRSFNELGSVLHVAAHPDDENTTLLTYLARGKGCRTAYLSLTRGDGGQNLLGPEFGETLGVLRTLEVKLPSARALVSTLSGGQRQSVAVAKSILRKAQLVLLDEPTAALGVAQTRQVLNLIRRLREQGLAVVVISHNLADVFEVVDRVIVLRLGKRVGTYEVKNTTPEQVVAAITGAEFGSLTEAPVEGNGSNGDTGGK